MKKLWNWILGILGLKKVPKWSECTLSSNWNGSNAQERMMNILSPNMSDAKFDERVSFMKSRGVNTVHVFVANKADGECAGYSPFGKNFTSYAIDKASCDVMTKRLKRLRDKGWAVVLWMMADDSNAWAKDVGSSIDKCRRYVKAVKDLGWFDMASTVVAGLEADEYWNATQCANMILALREVYKGKIGIHHCSENVKFAGMADILFYQCSPGKTAAQVKSLTKKALATGKPVNFFEMERNPSRAKCQAAMEAGAFAVGNW